MKAGRLFMVATPLGHLGDFSFRGVETLRGVAVVAAEDTRRTRRLLDHYGIAVRMVSLHAHSGTAAIERFLDRIAAGEDAAYVTDAGTPGISDPGGLLAERAHARGIPVVPIPGPGAVLAALSAAGLPADRFVFAGFRRDIARALSAGSCQSAARRAACCSRASRSSRGPSCATRRPAARPPCSRTSPGTAALNAPRRWRAS